MALGAMSPPQMSSPNLDMAVKMNPMDSMMMVFEDMRDNIAKIPEAIFELKDQVKTSISNLNKHLAFRFTELSKTAQKQVTGTSVPVESRDDLLGEADADSQGNMEEDTDSQGNEGGGFGIKLPKIGKPGPKLGLALLLGGFATLMAFGDKLVPFLAPILKFIKEKALPIAIDTFKMVLEGVKTTFNYLKENVWPFIRDNVITNAIDIVKDVFNGMKNLFTGVYDKILVIFGGKNADGSDATILDKLTALGGIFTDFGSFILGIGDSLITNVLEMFGVNFAPYDSAGAWVLGKLNEMWTGISAFFTDAGEFIVEGFTGAYDFVSKKVMGAFTAVGTWFSETGTFLLEGATGIVDWIKEKLKVPFAFLTDLFSFPESPKEFATKFIDLVLLPYNLAIKFIESIFGFSLSSDDEEFSLGTFIVDKVLDVVKYLKELFNFNLPDVGEMLKGAGDIIGSLLRAVLPSPDFLTFETPSVTLFGKKFGGGTISLNPIPAALYKAAGIDPETGEMLTPINTDTATETFVEPAERSALEQIKRNQRNMEIYGRGDEDDILRDGHTIESKLYELEMKNQELASQLSGAELKKLQEFQERQGYGQGSQIAVNTFNTDNSATDMSNTNAAPGTLNVEGSDSTARALAYSGYSATGDF